MVLKCPQSYAYKYILGLEGEDRGPLIRGTLGHVGIAHYYGRLGCQQHGKDPEVLYEPLTAVDLMAQKIGEAAKEFVDPVKSAILRYIAHFSNEQMEVIGVELPVQMEFLGELMTQRFDLVMRDKVGKVWIYDHKFVSKVEKKTAARYTLSGQFLEMVHQGERMYGSSFGGVRVNLIAVGYDAVLRATPAPAPFALQQFPQAVKDAEDVIRRNQHRDPWHWPRGFSETVCITPYGPCAYTELCRWGPK